MLPRIRRSCSSHIDGYLGARWRSFSVQHFPHFPHECSGREGLLKKRHARFQNTVPNHGVVRVPGDKHNLDARSGSCDSFGQDATAHFRHYDIRNEYVNRPVVRLSQSYGLTPVFRLHDRVAEPLKRTPSQPPHPRLVLDQQNRFGTLGNVDRLRTQLPLRIRSFRHGEVNFERGAPARFALQGDVATRLLNDTVDHGQA